MVRLTRRQFLDRQLAAVAGAALGGMAVSSSPLLTRRASANDTLNVVVVGVRGRGGSHIAEFGSRKDCRIAAIVDVDEVVGENKADEIEKNFGYRPKIYIDMREAFADKSLDIASIATPNHWHALAAIWAIQAGKDVYLEKPVSHNVSEGRRIVEAARKYGRVVQTGTQSRSNSGLREAIAYVHAGKLGQVKLARGLCYKPRGPIGPSGNYDVPASVNYDLWSGPAPIESLSRPNLHYDWHWMWAYGNGDLGNQGIHQMDIARWALNEQSLGKSVQSLGGRLGYEDAGETANTQISFHDYGDKRLVFEVRGLKTDPYRNARVGVIVEGSEGTLVIDSYHSAVVLDANLKEVAKFQGGGDKFHFDNFVKAVRARDHQLLNADIEQGHLSSALCHLANISYRLGTKQLALDAERVFAKDEVALETIQRTLTHLQENGVDLNTNSLTVGPLLPLTDNETFSGPQAAAANALLTREYRAPYVVPKTEDL